MQNSVRSMPSVVLRFGTQGKRVGGSRAGSKRDSSWLFRLLKVQAPYPLDKIPGPDVGSL